jgi:hypothetical protein
MPLLTSDKRLKSLLPAQAGNSEIRRMTPGGQNPERRQRNNIRIPATT